MFQSKQYHLLSDYASDDQKRPLTITKRDDGDVIFSIGLRNSCHIAMSGTRYSPEFRQAVQNFFREVEKEIERNRNPAIQEWNELIYPEE
jgi:hypothetical protein